MSNKGGGETQKVTIPQYITDASEANLIRAGELERLDYMPWYGPDVAAYNPTQLAAMQSNIDAAQAFGLLSPNSLTPAQGMPQAQEFAGGSRGYSSIPLYEQALAELKARQPEIFDARNSFFG
jgi:hypothetical protein